MAKLCKEEAAEERPRKREQGHWTPPVANSRGEGENRRCLGQPWKVNVGTSPPSWLIDGHLLTG